MLVRATSSQRARKLCGLWLVTTAALCFGVVAACVKAIDFPTFLLQQCRSTLEWVLCLSTGLIYRQCSSTPEQATSAENSAKVATKSLIEFLFGSRDVLGWVILRAVLQWCFVACWWSALNFMPVGDATALVYMCPFFTTLFSLIILRERVGWMFIPIGVLAVIGIVLLCKPSFIFGTTTSGPESLGILCGLSSAIIGGLLPVCTRKSKGVHWVAITHCSSLLSMVVFSPIALFVWTKVKPENETELSNSLGWLFGTRQLVHNTSPLGAWLLLLGVAGIGFAALAMQTKGYQLEQASRASMMVVLEIPFAYVLQAVIFGDPITPLGVLGAGFIGAATVLNVIRRQWEDAA